MNYSKLPGSCGRLIVSLPPPLFFDALLDELLLPELLLGQRSVFVHAGFPLLFLLPLVKEGLLLLLHLLFFDEFESLDEVYRFLLLVAGEGLEQRALFSLDFLLEAERLCLFFRFEGEGFFEGLGDDHRGEDLVDSVDWLVGVSEAGRFDVVLFAELPGGHHEEVSGQRRGYSSKETTGL